MDLKTLARDERTDLAAFLATLSPEQWAAPSLCAGWSVHEVVAHVISFDELTPGGLAARFAKGLLIPGRVNAVGVADYRRRSSEELLTLLNDHLEPQGFTAGFGGVVGLVDGLIHHQDIRRPLGLPREIPPERLLPTLNAALTAPLVRGAWRARGLRLVATDLEWSAGKGPEVHGPAESLLMAMAGRHGVVGELSGPGCPKLAARVGG